MRRPLGRRDWRAYDPRSAREIERRISLGAAPHCPSCGDALGVRRRTRLAAVLPGVIDGHDLECRCCRRFHARIRHNPHSRYLLRIQKLAAAVARA
jgi:hypothetical protein